MPPVPELDLGSDLGDPAVEAAIATTLDRAAKRAGLSHVYRGGRDVTIDSRDQR